MLGLVWSEVTVTTIQEGNGKGWFYRFYLKFCFISSRIYSGTNQHLHFREMSMRGDMEVWTWKDPHGLMLISVLLHTSIHPFPTWIWIWKKPQAELQMEHLETWKQFWLWDQLIVWLWAKPFWGSQSFHLSIYILKIMSVFAYVSRILCQLMGYWALFSPVSQ